MLDSDGAGGGSVVPGGKVSNFGLCEARRLRAFGDEVGGGTSEIFDVVGGGAGGITVRCISAVPVVGEAVVEDVFCLLEGGVSLNV